jgi:hypothetical protein
MQTFRRTLATLALVATAGTTVATALPADAKVAVSGACFTRNGSVYVDFEDNFGAWHGQYVTANRAGKIGPVTAPGWCNWYVAAGAQDVTTGEYVQIPVDMLSPCAY